MEQLLDAIERVADRTLGPLGAHDRELADAVAEMSDIYNRRRSSIARDASRERALAARLRFFLPRDLPKVGFPLAELASVDVLPRDRHWRILDVGAGLGASSLGIAEFAGQHELAHSLAIDAVDRDERALSVFRALAEELSGREMPALQVRTHNADVHSAAGAPDGPFDLIVVGFVLNELRGGGEGTSTEIRARLLDRLADRLTQQGSLLVLEPALRETSRALHTVRDRIVAEAGPPHVFAPCLRAGDCPMLRTQRDWCHEEADVPLPSRLVAVARAAGLRFERLTWAYLTLRRDRRTLRELAAEAEGEIYRIVSAPLRSKGKKERFGCGAPGRPRMVRLNRHASDENAPFDDLRRGNVVSVQPGEPDAERARLRIGPGTRLRRIR